MARVRRSKNNIVLTCFFVIITLYGHASANCPPSNILKPCICEDSGFMTAVVCKDITDMQTLVDVFDRTGDRNFSNFALVNSNIMYLPARAVSQKRFDELVVNGSTMASLFDEDLEESNQVSKIYLLETFFQRKIGWNLFKNIKNLDMFFANNTAIQDLGKDFVDNVTPGLQMLMMHGCSTRKLQYNAFQKMDQLSFIQIPNAEIKNLQRTMFASPAGIRVLDFSGNKIQMLPDDLFTNMPQLTSVVFDSNQISDLPESLLGHMWDQLQAMSFEDNPINCDCKLRWISTKSDKYKIKGTCEKPQEKRGVQIQSLSSKDFDYCP